MALLLLLLMALVPFVIGKGALRILYGNHPTQEMSPADSILTGAMIVIGLAEAAHLGGCILGRSFSDCVKLFGAGVGVCVLAAVVLLLIARRKAQKNVLMRKQAAQAKVKRKLSAGPTQKEQLIYLVFGILVIVQLISVATGQAVCRDGDMTLEVVNSFLESDAVYQVNPMTGKPYTLGIPLRLQILCLPTLYGALCQGFGLSAEALVTGVIPAFVLVGSYLAYGTVAKQLFPEKADYRGLFLVLVALLYSVGDYALGMDGFGVLYAGYRGVTIRGAVLLPYVFGLLLRKKYKLVVLCVLAEACIVWTLYGMGACVAVTAGILCVRFVCSCYERYLGKNSRQEGGKEDNL